MRVRIITIGSEGDVRPYVALGAGLCKAGHDVRVATHTGFEPLIREHGLDFAPVPATRENSDKAQLRALQDNRPESSSVVEDIQEVDAPLMRQRLRDCWEACSDADAIIVSVLPCLFGYAIAKKLQIPLVRAFYRQLHRRAITARILFLRGRRAASDSISRAFNFSVRFFGRSPGHGSPVPPRSSWVPKPASKCSVSGFDQSKQLILYCYSREVSPPPPDWPDFIDVTGYWFLDRQTNWTPPAALSAFSRAALRRFISADSEA